MNEIAANFEKATGCAVRVSTGSSGNFLTQIENGAPFDVFFSADIAYPKKLEAEGLAAPGSTYLYAVGKIVLWVRKDSRLDIGKGSSRCAILPCTKSQSPIRRMRRTGARPRKRLRKAGIYDAVKDRLVLGENISQAAQFAESGNADAGILALSLVLSPAMKDEGRYAAIPENLYTPIQQGAVIPRAAKNPQRAQEFLDYIKTPATAALLERYGFALCRRMEKKVNWQAIALSLKLAVCVAGILLAAGMPIAYWVTFSRWRWKFVVEAIVALPIVLPPTVLGYYILVGLGPRNFRRQDCGNRCSDTRCRSRLAACWSRPCSTVCRLRCSRFPRDLNRWIAG